ncbi:MAG: acyltransferase [Treponema sp.]|jgi:fucose 4-O-acetylase-like acetyltransferase|nr:acyltransferase [Treponema sp.]
MVLSIDENVSKRINSLRFLLIVFVVFIHNNPTEVNFASGTEIYTIPVYIAKIRHLVSGIIAAVAVPLFFFISGFLLYAKETTFMSVLKKKSRTILVPYIIWNILVALFLFVAQSFSFTKPYFAQNIIRNFGLLDWIDVFVGKFTQLRKNQYPLVYQFWFLRDLFILNLLFLGIKKLIDRFPFGTCILFFILWIAGINIYLVSTAALFYFSLGYYVIKYQVSYKKIDAIKRDDILLVYLITIVIELFLKEYVPIIHSINIVVGSIFFLKLTYYFIRNEKIYRTLAWLEKYAFFVYAIHGILLAVLQKLSVQIIPMHGGWILLQYFSVTILGILLFLTIGIIVRKITPKIYALLTGGRL